MLIDKSRGIVISTIPYSDTSLIVRIFTREHGLKSFLVKGARKGNNTFKASYFMPLSLLELVFVPKEGDGLHMLKECRPQPILQSLRTLPLKNQISIFMAEVLSKALHEGHADKELFDFAQLAVLQLEAEVESLAAFPCWFLVKMTDFIGFSIEVEESATSYFNIAEGTFTQVSIHSPNQLGKDESKMLLQLVSQTQYPEFNPMPTKEIRTRVLEGMIRFYQYHFWDLNSLKSLEILKMLSM